MTADEIKAILQQVKYPGFSRDIISFGIVQNIQIQGQQVSFDLKINTSDPKIAEQIYKEAHQALESAGIQSPSINLDVQSPQATASEQTTAGKSSIPGIKKIIAVGSGKGGVGKSTASSNLARSLAQQGYKVGICDCDLYGPSLALLFGAQDHRPGANEKDEIIPIEVDGIKIMSMGFLLSDSSPVIVRGPLANRYTQQFLRQVAWGELDYLILDLPPGTGDIQLTIVQTVSLDGAIIVTTPNEISLIDARKAVAMFSKVNVKILGIIENMSWFECDHGKKYYLFGKDGGKKEAERLNVPLLAQIPIEQDHINIDLKSLGSVLAKS